MKVTLLASFKPNPLSVADRHQCTQWDFIGLLDHVASWLELPLIIVTGKAVTFLKCFRVVNYNRVVEGKYEYRTDGKVACCFNLMNLLR